MRHVPISALFGTLLALGTASSARAEESPVAPVVPPVAQPVPADASAAAAVEPLPLAGSHGGLFFLRDANDEFRLYPQLRAQIDSYNYLGPGVPDTTLKSTIFVRRARPELSGEILGRWQFMIAGDFGASGVDNPKGTNETQAAPPGADPTAATARYGAAQTPSVKAAPTDVFVNYRAAGWLNVQVGQYDVPFTMENRTSDKYIPFMERSLAIRNVGAPTNKDLGAMVWGETADKLVFYSVGIFDGDGQNRPNVDNRFDTYGRVFTHPFAKAGGPLEGVQLGASFHYGMRDKNYVAYDVGSYTTQGSYAFWNPNHKGSDSAGNPAQLHVIPAGAQLGVAGELRVPIDRVDLTGELVWIRNGTREAIEGYQATNSERFGDIRGYAYYAQLGVWVFGPRDLSGLPGYENPTHLDLRKPAKPAKSALQLLAKWEQLHVRYEGASRSGTVDAKNADGDVRVNALSLGANYWATKHLRLSANYVMNMFPDSAPSSESAAGGPSWKTTSQRAQAPGNGLDKKLDDDARDHAHVLHELLFRVAVAF